MKTIFKYAITPGAFTVDLPAFAQILTVACQHGKAFFWALVDTEADPVTRHFRTCATGEEVGLTRAVYVGTFHLPGDGLVFHLFESTLQATARPNPPPCNWINEKVPQGGTCGAPSVIRGTHPRGGADVFYCGEHFAIWQKRWIAAGSPTATICWTRVP